MSEATALSPHLGVQVTGVGSLLDDTLVSRCLEALVSEEAGYITGQIIGVNGGRNT
jgi:hypothetical protein